MPGFIQDFSRGGGGVRSSVRKHAQTRGPQGSGGMLPQENFDVYNL